MFSATNLWYFTHTIDSSVPQEAADGSGACKLILQYLIDLHGIVQVKEALHEDGK